MTVESFLTRDLQVRFIDARNLTTEAKLQLGIIGYPTPEEETIIIERAQALFHQQPESVQTNMKRLSVSLETVKRSNGSFSVCSSTEHDMDDSDDSSSCGTTDSGTITSTTSNFMRRINVCTKFQKIWCTRR